MENYIENSFKTDILSIEDSMGQCQRNWLPEQISKHDKQEIIDTIVKMPTKQSLDTYSLWVSSDQKLNERIHLEAGQDTNDFDQNGNERASSRIRNAWGPTSEKSPTRRYTNGQLSAPLLILFLENALVKETSAIRFRNLGVAAGGAIVRAHQLGYKTGLCVCIDNKVARRIIKEHTGHSLGKSGILLALGIGKPNPNYVRNLNFGPNRQSEIYVQPLGPKKISVTEWC